jgi:hypothetical protein
MILSRYRYRPVTVPLPSRYHPVTVFGPPLPTVTYLLGSHFLLIGGYFLFIGDDFSI